MSLIFNLSFNANSIPGYQLESAIQNVSATLKSKFIHWNIRVHRSIDTVKIYVVDHLDNEYRVVKFERPNVFGNYQCSFRVDVLEDLMEAHANYSRRRSLNDNDVYVVRTGYNTAQIIKDGRVMRGRLVGRVLR